jgi:predicted ABC-class ATPase
LSGARQDGAALADRLRRLDGRGYRAYRELEGCYRLETIELHVDRVQGDPFAEPSRLRLVVDQACAAFPGTLTADTTRRMAAADFVQRRAAALVERLGRAARGSGHSGRVEVEVPGQQVLPRTGVRLDDQRAELRLRVGLPAAGRTILGDEARRLLLEELPRLGAQVLRYTALDGEALAHHVRVVEGQEALRQQLGARGLVAFVADGASLPRRSGVDDRRLTGESVVPFEAPASLEVELSLPGGGTVRGLGIAEGVTLIVGGGFHGKSTLLRTLALGVYDHAPGDGRERCVTRADAVQVRAEDGRSVTAVDISPFIGTLPGGRETRRFTTRNASGSTSQAASTVEAIAAGSRLLLIDEDTSATNFMIRDARMQRLVPAASEPIVPFVDRIRELHERLGVSTVLVMGGSGDYLDVADHVVHMDHYRPCDVTAAARSIAGTIDVRLRERHAALRPSAARRPRLGSLETRQGRRDRLRARGRRTIQVGHEEIDLAVAEQLVETGQTRAIADALGWLRDRERLRCGAAWSVAELLDDYEALVTERGLDAITGWPAADRARPRRHELAAAIDRYRGLELAD